VKLRLSDRKKRTGSRQGDEEGTGGTWMQGSVEQDDRCQIAISGKFLYTHGFQRRIVHFTVKRRKELGISFLTEVHGEKLYWKLK
jgi:hypothetical protein